MSEETWGQFWLPQTPENVRYGLLSQADDGELQLRFGGDFTLGLEEVEPTGESPGYLQWRHDEDDDTKVVHGWLNQSPKAVTLFDCVTVHRSVTRFGRMDGSEQTLRPLFGLRGDHVSAETTYGSLLARYAGLDAWCNLSVLALNQSQKSPAAIDYVPSMVIPHKLANDGLVSVYPQLTPTVDCRGARLDQRAWLQIEGVEPCTARELDRKYVSPMQTLLTLCLGKPAKATEVWYLHGERWLLALGRGSNHEDSLRDSLHAANVPLAFYKLRTEGLASWLDEVERLGPLPPIVANLVSGQHTMTIESQVIELTSVAEGLCRRAISNRKKSYKQRLTELAAAAESALPGVTGRTQQWCSIVERARNDFTHRQNEFIGAGDEVDVLLVVVKSLRLALRAFLLRFAAVPDQVISSSLKETQEWDLFIKQARRIMPDVYSEV